MRMAVRQEAAARFGGADPRHSIFIALAPRIGSSGVVGLTFWTYDYTAGTCDEISEGCVGGGPVAIAELGRVNVQPAGRSLRRCRFLEPSSGAVGAPRAVEGVSPDGAWLWPLP